MADEDNYLVRLLLGFPVSQQEIDGVNPETGFQWQRDKYDQGPHIRELTPEEAEFNTLDVDVLKAVFLESCSK
jgi:hypothetical protein